MTFVHKGNIMKFTEGAFKDWGYALAASEFGATPLDGGPWQTLTNPRTGREIVVKDMIADAMLQQILTRPDEYDVIATMNLNGDYLSDRARCPGGGDRHRARRQHRRHRRRVRGHPRHGPEVCRAGTRSTRAPSSSRPR